MSDTESSSLKWCCGCDDHKLRSEFTRNGRRKDGLNSWCKACQKAYGERNRGEHIGYYRRYWAANRERMLAYQHEQKDRRSQQLRAWKRANPQKVNDYEARRHARKRANGCGEPYARLDIAFRDGWLCHLCGHAIDPSATVLRETFTVDHVIPLSKGGADAPHNLKAAHFGCNAAKSNRQERRRRRLRPDPRPAPRSR